MARVAIVTGGTRGIGEAISVALKDMGMKVAANYAGNEERARAFTERTGIPAYKWDVADYDACQQGVQQVEADLGPVDVLVNNAAVTTIAKAEGTDDDEWRRTLAVNLDGAFYWSRAVMPSMRKRGWGRIINVGSLAAKTGGLTTGIAYSASKGALTSLSFALARESAADGVTVNVIAPAYVKTNTITEGLNESQRRILLARIPVGRFCEPEEFAHAVRFLASPLAGFITGEVLDVNGGLQMD